MLSVMKCVNRQAKPITVLCRNLSAMPEPAVLQSSSYDITPEVPTPEIPHIDFTPDKYDGPTYDEIRRIRSSTLTPAALTYHQEPLLVNQGYMQYLWDHKGNQYLDCIGGMITISVGHCHPRVVSAIQKQTKKLWHTSSIWMHKGIHEYAEKFIATLPAPLNKGVVYFVNSGSEANDMATMMARLHTGAHDIVGLRHGYHGGSPAVMPLTAMGNWRFKMATPGGFHQTINPDVYKGIWGGNKCRDSPIQADRACDCMEGQCMACDNYVDQLDQVLRHCTPNSGMAAFIAEPIQGGGGTNQYPKEYLKKAYELVRSRGGVCISDEVQTGFGRSGTHYWGFEGHGVVPDIMTTAKGIGNGFPMAAVVTTQEIAASLNPNKGNSSALHFNTFGGNPLACAVGSEVLDVLEDENCQQNSHIQGTHILHGLAKLKDEFDIIGDVRGKGLLIGVELVRDKKTRKPIDKNTYMNIWENLKNRGILAGKGGIDGNVFRIKPPMCLTMDDAQFILDVFRKVLSDHRADPTYLYKTK